MNIRKISPLFLAALFGCARTGATKSDSTTAPPSTPVPAPSVVVAASPPTEVPSKGSDPRVAKALKRMARLRELAPKSEVPGVTLSRDELLAKVRAHVDTEVPMESIVLEGRELVLYDQLPETTDYLATTFALLEEELAGFYSPEAKSMYLASDLEGDMATATLNHEIVHALQDQHFGLEKRMKYRDGASDLATATSALAEGDATSAMFDALLASQDKKSPDQDDATTLRLMRLGMVTTNPNIPPVLREGLLAPYAYGLLFTNHLRRRGGWAAVDAAWESPPTTTEQILHPEKFLAKEGALAVATPTFAELGPSAKLSQADEVGELDLRILATEWIGATGPQAPIDEAAAGQAAHVFEGWGGGRSAFVTIDGTASAGRPAVASSVHVVFDADRPKGAHEAFLALREPLLKRGPSKRERPLGNGTDYACIERPNKGPLAIGAKGNSFYVLAGPSRPGTTAADPWQNMGSCDKTRQWFVELISQK